VFVGLDTGMNHFVRPALGAYHRILNGRAGCGIEWVEIVGNVCRVHRRVPFGPGSTARGGRASPRYSTRGPTADGLRHNLWPLPSEVVIPVGTT
jgi:hypothetical protein